MSQDYIVKEVNDFLKIPKESIDLCLSDFKEWIEFMHHVKDMPLPKGVSKIIPAESFYWCDDGISGLSKVNISLKVGE